jgi:CelD/BcsL family acetyltransferase involved in cellulose biosynthesis
MLSSMIKIFNNYSYELYNTLNDVMIDKWQKFERNSNSTIFQKFFFVNNWNTSINKKKDHKLYIIFIYHDDSLIAILPLCIRNFFSIKILQWIGEPFNDFNFPILDNKLMVSNDELNKVIYEIININKKDYSLVYLEKQLTHFRGQKNIFDNFKNISTDEKNSALALSESFEYFFNNHRFFKSSKYKKILASIIRFKIKYKSSYTNDNDFNFKNDVYNFFLINKSDRINQTGAWNYLKFSKYTDFIHLNLRNRKCLCNAIYIDNKIISATIGFIDNETFYYIFPSYDSKWGKISPGLINLYLSFKDFFENKLCNRFDFTIGNEPYKDVWSNEATFLFQSFFATSIKGCFLMPFLNYRNRYSNTFFFKILKYIFKKIKK